MGGGTFFKVGGGTSARQKTLGNFCGLNWQWRHKYWNIAYTPREGLKYTILDKIITKKRMGKTEIQIGWYRGDPRQQRHSGSSCDLFRLNKTVRRFCHWNFHLLAFWLALSLLC